MCKKRIPHTEMCPACRTCKSHHMDNYAELFPMRQCALQAKHIKGATFLKNVLPRALGSEIEVSHPNGAEMDKNLRKLGQWVHDGSVEPSGQEFVAKPTLGDAFPEQVARICSIFGTYGSAVNASCGVHVHVDAADLSIEAIRRLYVVFAVVQNNLFGTLVHANRQNPSPNGVNYCAKLVGNSDYLIEMMGMPSDALRPWLYNYLYGLAWPSKPKPQKSELVYKRLLADYRKAVELVKEQLHVKQTHKYENEARRQALNFHSWMMRGTVEFRLKEGTVDPIELLNWPLWCGWFVEKVAAMRDDTVQGMIVKPPTVLELTHMFYRGKLTPPIGLCEWVEQKVANPTTKKKVDTPPVRVRVVNREAFQAQQNQFYVNANAYGGNLGGVPAQDGQVAPQPQPAQQQDVFEEWIARNAQIFRER